MKSDSFSYISTTASIQRCGNSHTDEAATICTAAKLTLFEAWAIETVGDSYSHRYSRGIILHEQ